MLLEGRRFVSGTKPSIVLSAVSLGVFLLLVSPSVVMFQPRSMAWDELYLLHRSVCLHNAVYRLDFQEMAGCYSILSKAPALTFLALPWGPVGSGEGIIPLTVIGLAILIWLVVLLTYHVARSAGASSWALAAAALAVWTNPFLSSYGGAFLSDMLLAWITLLFLLLIPLELRTNSGKRSADVCRGILWAFVISVGVLTKVTFGFFLAVAGVAVVWIRCRRSGARHCLLAVITALVCTLPAAAIWLAFGRNFLAHAAGASFGGMARFFAKDGMGPGQYLRDYASLCASAIVPTVVLILYSIWQLRRTDQPWWRLLPIILMLAYLSLCAVSQNRDFRFAMPVMVALPFLCAVVPSVRSEGQRPGLALLTAGLLAGVVCSIPIVSRLDLTHVRYAGSVLDRIAAPGVKILVATDGRPLNIETFLLAKEIRGTRMQGVILDTLVYDSIRGLPLDASYRRLESADYVLFHKPPFSTELKWANQFAEAYWDRAVKIAESVDASSELMRIVKIQHAGPFLQTR